MNMKKFKAIEDCRAKSPLNLPLDEQKAILMKHLGPALSDNELFAEFKQTLTGDDPIPEEMHPHYRQNLQNLVWGEIIQTMLDPEYVVTAIDGCQQMINRNRVYFEDSFVLRSKDKGFSPLAHKETVWDHQIKQSPYYEHFTPENIDRFKAFLTGTDSRHSGRPADFFIKYHLSEGVPASMAGELVKFYCDEESGFWDREKSKRVNTITDMAKKALLQQLPSESNRAMEFGSVFEPLASAAFKAWYKKEKGYDLISVKSAYYEDMLQCEATGGYRQGTDETFFSKDENKFIVTDFKMPQVYSKSATEFNSRSHGTDMNYVYQMSLYGAAAHEALPKDAIIETRLVKFGMSGLMDHLDRAQGADGHVHIEKLKEMVVEGILKDDPSVRLTSQTITPAEGTVEKLLLPALEYYQGFLNAGQIPKEDYKNNCRYSDEHYKELVDMNHQLALLESLATKLDARNDVLKAQMATNVIRNGGKITNELAQTTETKRVPKPADLFRKALAQGMCDDKAAFMKSQSKETPVIDRNLLKGIMSDPDVEIGFDDIAKVSRQYKAKKRFDKGPQIDMVADQTLSQIKHIKLNLRTGPEHKEEHAPQMSSTPN